MTLLRVSDDFFFIVIISNVAEKTLNTSQEFVTLSGCGLGSYFEMISVVIDVSRVGPSSSHTVLLCDFSVSVVGD